MSALTKSENEAAVAYYSLLSLSSTSCWRNEATTTPDSSSEEELCCCCCGHCLQVLPSAVRGAGLGLVTARARRRGEVVCMYQGRHKTTVQAMRTKDKSYLMRLGTQCYIDAQQTYHVLARYINDCRNAKGYNVTFDKTPARRLAFVRATRDLRAGEELFVDYGRLYWAMLPSEIIEDAALPAFGPGFT